MRDITDIFVELGRRLVTFGEDNASREVIARAIAENGWFTEGDIRYAVSAICEDMLDAEKVSNWLSHYPAAPTCAPRRVAIIMAGNIPLVGFFDERGASQTKRLRSKCDQMFFHSHMGVVYFAASPTGSTTIVQSTFLMSSKRTIRRE